MKGISLRSAIDQCCKQCIYDNLCPGTWRQQTTLCNIEKCPLWPVRPKSASAIPESVLRWYRGEKEQSGDINAQVI
jgi:hypothetical protein